MKKALGFLDLILLAGVLTIMFVLMAVMYTLGKIMRGLRWIFIGGNTDDEEDSR